MSFTIPQTHIDTKKPFRAYVVFYYEGKRQRLYNGKPLGKDCNPNYQRNLTDKKRELARLCQLISEALKKGWNPTVPLPEEVPTEKQPLLIQQLRQLQQRFSRNGWSDTYRRDMTRITNEFLHHLQKHHPLATSTSLKPLQLTEFLDSYRSSGRYYMNKRRNLSALYKLLEVETNPVAATPVMKVTEQLNEAYTPQQLVPILTYLKGHSSNLYLCALFTYGTLLRPHREIRLLRRADFDLSLDYITLGGKATKNGRIRKVPVPGYIKAVLLERNVVQMPGSAYIFTGTDSPLNPDYFTTAWSRVKAPMLDQGLLREEQTLYSFRHSAAIYAFSQHQNIKMLQSLMGHGSPDVSIKYLRSLGVMDASSPDDMPRLPGS